MKYLNLTGELKVSFRLLRLFVACHWMFSSVWVVIYVSFCSLLQESLFLAHCTCHKLPPFHSNIAKMISRCCFLSIFLQENSLFSHTGPKISSDLFYSESILYSMQIFLRFLLIFQMFIDLLGLPNVRISPSLENILLFNYIYILK